MPEYLSPGVYIEETSFRAKSIQGVATSTAGFVGVCRSGPVQGPPPLVTSFEEFRRMFGGIEDLVLSGSPTTNYLAFAVKSFFDNGGKRLYIARIHNGAQAASSAVLLRSGATLTRPLAPAPIPPFTVDFASGTTLLNPRFAARSRGVEGNVPVQITGLRGSNALRGSGGTAKLVGLKPGDVVEVTPAPATQEKSRRVALDATDPQVHPLTTAQLRWVRVDDTGRAFLCSDAAGTEDAAALTGAAFVQRVTLTVEVGVRGDRVEVYGGLSTHPSSPSYIATVLRDVAPADGTARVYFALDADLNAADFGTLLARLVLLQSITLAGGTDGAAPTLANYTGAGTDETATGLVALGEIEDIAIVAAPGSSTLSIAQDVRNQLITHCENLKFRFAILSAPDGLDEAGIRSARSQHDTTYAALYYPWITIRDPFSQSGEMLSLPPEGSVAGVYARTDIERGVHKAPANEIVRDALRFSRRVTTGSQDTLNPEGINCLRSFEGRGNRIWGARTMSSDTEWTYVNVRRLFIYLEHSIEKNTKWVVFEPNNETLWLKVRLTIESFLLEVWRTGALMGLKPQEAFFVRCDRSTMTQSDLDNGRLIVLIGVAPTKPAEFVIFRIGQWTADASIV